MSAVSKGQLGLREFFDKLLPMAYAQAMVKINFRVIPEGIVYNEADVSREGVFDTLNEALGFLNFLAARADEESGTAIGSLLYGSVAQKIVNGDRYGHHRITLGDFVPLIVEWSLEDDGRHAFGRVMTQ